MDQNISITVQVARGNHYFSIMRTSIFAEAGVAAIIVLGDASGHTLALQAIIVGLAIFAVLAGDTALKDIKNLISDMDDETASSNFGKGAQATPYSALRAISAVVHILIAIALLASI